MKLQNRYLVVGSGSAGKRHVECIKKIDPNSEIRLFRKAKIEIEGITNVKEISNIKQVIDFQPNIGIIANPSTFHIETAEQLLALECDMLIEKPLSDSLDKAVAFYKIGYNSKQIISVGYNLRFSILMMQLKDYLLSSVIGEIFTLNILVGHNLLYWRKSGDYRNQVSAQKKLGGGVLLELSHEFDYLRWILGDLEWVWADTYKKSNLEIDVEDSAHIIMGFAPSTLGNQVTASLNLDFVRADKTREIQVIGELGTIKIDLIAGYIQILGDNGSVSSKEYVKMEHIGDSYVDQLSDFLECVENRRQPKVTLMDGLETMKTIEMCRKSTVSGNKIYSKNFELPNLGV